MSKKKIGKHPELIHSYRKLIKVGNSFAITIPKEWVEAHGYKEGDIFAQTANSFISSAKRDEA